MELDVSMRNEFREKVRSGVKSLIELNEIDDLEDFDPGLYISNVFERTLKKDFDLNEMAESKKNSLRSFLWSSVYTDLEIKAYESYIQKLINI